MNWSITLRAALLTFLITLIIINFVVGMDGFFVDYNKPSNWVVWALAASIMYSGYKAYTE